MKLGIIKNFWTKFQDFSKSLGILIKSLKFKTTFAFLNFNSNLNSNLKKFNTPNPGRESPRSRSSEQRC
jgi:hypothetical protein